MSRHNNVAWAEVSLPTKWQLDLSSRLATIDMGRKVGLLCPFFGAGSHLTQCCLVQGLPPYQVVP